LLLLLLRSSWIALQSIGEKVGREDWEGQVQRPFHRCDRSFPEDCIVLEWRGTAMVAAQQ